MRSCSCTLVTLLLFVMPALSAPCFDAIRQWRFNPIVKDEKHLPYRAQIVFRVP